MSLCGRRAGTPAGHGGCGEAVISGTKNWVPAPGVNTCSQQHAGHSAKCSVASGSRGTVGWVSFWVCFFLKPLPTAPFLT